MANKLYLKLPKERISFLNKIIEGYDNLGVVTTLNAKKGLVMIQMTPDTENTIRKIIAELEFIEIVQKE